MDLIGSAPAGMAGARRKVRAGAVSITLFPSKPLASGADAVPNGYGLLF